MNFGPPPLLEEWPSVSPSVSVHKMGEDREPLGKDYCEGGKRKVWEEAWHNAGT